MQRSAKQRTTLCPRRVLLGLVLAVAAVGVRSEEACSPDSGPRPLEGPSPLPQQQAPARDRDVVLLQLNRGELSTSKLHETEAEDADGHAALREVSRSVGARPATPATGLSRPPARRSAPHAAAAPVTVLADAAPEPAKPAILTDAGASKVKARRGPGIVDQPGAVVPPGGNVKILFMGTSNVVWQTWPDHVNLLLRNLGYTVSTPDLPIGQGLGMWAHPDPLRTPICDDADAFVHVETRRVGKIGWGSWGFAYESRDDCDQDGFRIVAGLRVSCLNGWACQPSDPEAHNLVKPSQVAEWAADVNAVVLSNWINDPRQHWSNNACFGGNDTKPIDTVAVSIEDLVRLIRAIHARNPQALVAVMGLYPDAAGEFLLDYAVEPTHAVNAALKAALEREPNTVFVDYEFPPGVQVYQTKNPGHPNCRGDKVMATAAVDAMFRARLLTRGLDPDSGPSCDPKAECLALSYDCCQRTARCFNAEDGLCRPYSTGLQIP